jgi:hypothetical protein
MGPQIFLKVPVLHISLRAANPTFLKLCAIVKEFSSAVTGAEIIFLRCACRAFILSPYSKYGIGIYYIKINICQF